MIYTYTYLHIIIFFVQLTTLKILRALTYIEREIFWREKYMADFFFWWKSFLPTFPTQTSRAGKGGGRQLFMLRVHVCPFFHLYTLSLGLPRSTYGSINTCGYKSKEYMYAWSYIIYEKLIKCARWTNIHHFLGHFLAHSRDKLLSPHHLLSQYLYSVLGRGG